MSDLSITRTPELIAAEINGLKAQGRAILLYHSIEIGRRLAEAHQLIAHGGWGDWLHDNVAYSASTANNLIRVFEAFGDRTAGLTGEANLQALGDLDLSYTQAVALLALPEEERAAFIEDHDVANMSSRELQAAIRERDEERRLREEAERKLADAEEDAKLAQQTLDGQRTIANTLEEQKRAADAKAKELEDKLRTLQAAKASTSNSADVAKLKQQLAQAEEDRKKLAEDLEAAKAAAAEVQASYTGVENVVPPEVQQELDTLRATKAFAAESARFRAAFDLVTDAFGKLLDAMAGIPQEEQPKYRKAVGALLTKMAERNGGDTEQP